MRSRTAAGAVLLFLAGCYQSSCNFEVSECGNDYDCGIREICSGFLFGTCVSARTCISDGDCKASERCIPPDAASKGSPPRKSLCQCRSFECGYQGGSGGEWPTGGEGPGGFGGGLGGGSPYCDGSAAPKGMPISSLSIGGIEEQSRPLLAGTASAHRVVALPFQGAFKLGKAELVSKGDYDVAIARLEEGGKVEWAFSFGDATPQRPTAIATQGENVVVALGFTGTIDLGTGVLAAAGAGNAAVVFALDDTGKPQWARVLTGNGDVQVSSLAVRPNGAVLAAGSFTGELDTGSEKVPSVDGKDAFLVELTPAAADGWLQVVGGKGEQEVSGLAIDGNGSTLVAASFDGEITSGMEVYTSNGPDVLVMKYLASRQIDWARQIAGPGREIATGLAVDVDWNVIVTGVRGSLMEPTSGIDFGAGMVPGVGPVDTFVLKLQGGGGLEWGRIFGGPADMGNAVPQAVAIDCLGNIVVVGSATAGADFGGGALTAAGGRDAFVFKLDRGGHHLWSRAFGGPADDQAFGLAISGAAALVPEAIRVSGSFADTADLGLGPLVSAGGDDVFLLDLTP